MTEKKRKKPSRQPGRDSVEINIKGNYNAVATHKSTASVTNDETIPLDLKAWQRRMEQEINALKSLPAEDKSILTQNIEQIKQEAEKGRNADEGRMERLLNTLGAMAPDILDVAITTLGNPLAGLGLVAKKIGEKAQVTKKA
jgi:hypothetical protein